MGDYASMSELIDRVGGNTRAAQLTTESGSTPDTTQLERLIGEAEAKVNSYVGRHMPAAPVDLASFPELLALLKGATLTIAAYGLHGLRPPVPPDLEKLHGQTVQWLRDIANSVAKLPVDSALPSPPGGGLSAQVDGANRVMTRDNLSGLG